MAATASQKSDKVPLDRHHLVSSLMCPARPGSVPSWDLLVVLEVLSEPPFLHLESVSDQVLTLKVSFLLKLVSLKPVGDLQALSVSGACMESCGGVPAAQAWLCP